jgi:hypothetical protein
VTLKASDAPAAPSAAVTPVAPPTAPIAPPAPPVAPKPPSPTAPMVRPPVATAPMATVPAPSVPSATSSAPAPAPTIPLKTAGPMARPTPAPTIKLNTGSSTGAPTVPLKTAGPMPGLAGPATKPMTPPLPGNTVALPKATVQLAPPTQPMITGSVSATQMATFQAEDEEDAGSDTMTTVLSIFGFLAACAVLAFQCMTISLWEGWNQLF